MCEFASDFKIGDQDCIHPRDKSENKKKHANNQNRYLGISFRKRANFNRICHNLFFQFTRGILVQQDIAIGMQLKYAGRIKVAYFIFKTVFYSV